MISQATLDFDTPVITDVCSRYDGRCPYPELHYYGIIQENSHIRAHVGPVAKQIYVYKTSDMIDAIIKKDYRKLSASQPGAAGVTGYGPVVPLNDIPFVIPVLWRSEDWWTWFRYEDDTGCKGRMAVKVISEIMKRGRFPFFVVPQEVTEIKMDIDGTDIIVSGKWHVQVKCDWKAGPRDIEGCSGNLFVQTHERNPFGRY